MDTERSYSLLLVDDDPMNLDILESAIGALSDVPSFEVTKAVGVDCLREVIERREACAFDIVIMDIDLGDDVVTGVDFVRRFFPPECGTRVIYHTAHLQLVPKAFETQFDYILPKPLSREALRDAFEKVVEGMESRPRETCAITVPVLRGVKRIRCADILWLESDQHKVLIHTVAGPIETRGPLGDLANTLPTSFMRIHRKYVVNLLHVELVDERVHMDDGSSLSISRTLRKRVKAAFVNHLGSTL